MQREKSVRSVANAARGSPSALGQRAELRAERQVVFAAARARAAVIVFQIPVVAFLTALAFAISAIIAFPVIVS